jgi:acetyltransferase-like isoleucine patch superfamily enzyme
MTTLDAVRAMALWEAVRARLRARRAGLRAGVEIGPKVRFGPDVRCSANGGRIVIGAGSEVGGGTSLLAQPGAILTLEERVFVAGGCIIAAGRHVSIGAESMVAELVSIRDHDHDPAYPPRSGRTLQADVRIGKRVWIGAKATVVRGGRIDDDAVIGAHALVNRPVPAAALAAGVPARVKRQPVR